MAVDGYDDWTEEKVVQSFDLINGFPGAKQCRNDGAGRGPIDEIERLAEGAAGYALFLVSIEPSEDDEDDDSNWNRC